MAALCTDVGLPLPGYWTFTDYAANAFPTPQGAGEYSYGLVNVTGSVKPAATTVQKWFSGAADLDFNGALIADSTGVPLGWSKTGNATFSYDPINNAAGLSNADPVNPAGWYTSPITAIRRGHRYEAGCDIRVNGVVKAATVRIAWLDWRGNLIRVDSSSPTTGAADAWARLHVNGISPGDACQIHCSLLGAGTAWFRNPTFNLAPS
jgi:hypothetical protein